MNPIHLPAVSMALGGLTRLKCVCVCVRASACACVKLRSLDFISEMRWGGVSQCCYVLTQFREGRGGWGWGHDRRSSAQLSWVGRVLLHPPSINMFRPLAAGWEGLSCSPKRSFRLDHTSVPGELQHSERIYSIITEWNWELVSHWRFSWM